MLNQFNTLKWSHQSLRSRIKSEAYQNIKENLKIGKRTTHFSINIWIQISSERIKYYQQKLRIKIQEWISYLTLQVNCCRCSVTANCSHSSASVGFPCRFQRFLLLSLSCGHERSCDSHREKVEVLLGKERPKKT